MSIIATCATIGALLVSAKGGETINLKGNCAGVTISRHYAKLVTIDATRSSVRGLVITGGNVRWRGGRIAAKDGAHGFAGNGYGVHIHGGAANVTLEGVTITAAKKGIVIDQARNLNIASVAFTGLGEDGIIASRVTGLAISRSQFGQTIGKPTQCLVNGAVRLGLPMRDCAGQWTDGYHPDAVQMRNGVVDARISHNLVEGRMQGITQMDTTGDAPLQRVFIEHNIVRTDNFHHITLGDNCIGCAIRNNRVERAAGSAKRAIIRAGAAQRCGNFAQDERNQDDPC